MSKIGILGGTFNPPHEGHLALARCAREQLDLDKVLLMPANVAPNKPATSDDPNAKHRLAMCRLAASAAEGVQACALEIERGGVSYTVDTLHAIHDREPNAKLTLILGADTARTLPGWREPERLLCMAGLAVAERDGLDEHEVRAAIGLAHDRSCTGEGCSQADTVGMLDSAQQGERSLEILRMQKVPVSSSEVRELVAAGEPVSHLVGEAVARYIAEHNLYRDPATVAREGQTR